MNKYLNINGWLFVGPAVGLLLLFNIYPIVWSIWLSLHSGHAENLRFVGINNVIRLYNDPVFLQALYNTLFFLVFQVPIMIIIALVVSTILNNEKIMGKALIRTIIILPCITSLVAYSVLFKSMFVDDGIVNNILLSIGIIAEPTQWLTDPFWAKVLIVMALIWRWTGYYVIFYLAALQNIDKSIYDAAKIDGISKMGEFFFITVPLLKPTILFTAVTATIGTLQLFDEVVSITNGGPANATLSITMYIYNLTFKFFPNFGYASAVSYSITFLAVMLAAMQFYVARDNAKKNA